MVSVILPTYNRAHFIPYAIQSVLDQTYKDIELIVINDGSTDETEKVIKPYLKDIIYIYQQNNGSGKARNQGIKAAKGEYIAFIDDDDFWLPWKLELQMELFNKHKELGIICTNFSTFNEKEECPSSIKEYFGLFKRTKLDFDTIFKQKKNITFKKNNLYFYWGNIFPTLIQGSLIHQVSILTKKSILEEIGLYNESLSDNEDYDVCLKIGEKFEIGFADIDTVKIRLSAKTRSNDESTRIRFWENNLQIISKAIKDSNKKELLDKKSIDNRFVQIYQKIAYYSLSDGDFKKSRYYLMKIIKNAPIQAKPYLLTILTFVPYSFILMALSIKRKLQKI